MEKKVFIKRRSRRRKICIYCANKTDVIDYKNLDMYKRFITDRGKIVPKRNSGICAKHQRHLALVVKRARFIGLVPYCVD